MKHLDYWEVIELISDRSQYLIGYDFLHSNTEIVQIIKIDHKNLKIYTSDKEIELGRVQGLNVLGIKSLESWCKYKNINMSDIKRHVDIWESEDG